ncbi:hypothetical protein BD560DRAFT_403539 [Blakeslea trispora]|nr:hypothetical protein BD560DRAFT_403539 [Blakeslea trispora]
MLQKRNQAVIPGTFPSANQITHHSQRHRYLNFFSRLKHVWKRKPAVQQENNLNLSLTVNNHYHYSQNHKPSTSIVQQIIIMPQAQAYSLMALIALFLVIVGFALLQVHRVLSILQVILDSLTYIAFTSMSGLGSVVRLIKHLIV